MGKANLQQILQEHKEWLETGKGKKARLRDADLQEANLREADLWRADLRGADLQDADLQDADLRGADLRGANLDFSSGIPFHCGGANFKCDMKLVYQILAHLMTLQVDDAEFEEIKQKIKSHAIKSHRAKDLGLADK